MRSCVQTPVLPKKIKNKLFDYLRPAIEMADFLEVVTTVVPQPPMSPTLK
jgi:hypothetical protein